MTVTELRSVCEASIAQGVTAVPEDLSKQIVASYGVRVPEGAVVGSAQEAVAFARRTGYPVALKAVSPEILHKTELGAVALGLRTDGELEEAFGRMEKALSAKGAAAKGYLVETMVSGGVEFIVGLQNDPQFGPVLMLGTGGTLIHLVDDVAFRVLPIGLSEARDLIGEIRGKALLRGFRGRPPLDEEGLAQAIVRIGQLGMDAAGLYDSMDFNPLIVTEQATTAVDAKIVLARQPSETPISQAEPNTAHLEHFFSPRSVALLGASTTPGRIGNAVADSLMNHDFDGKVFPVTRGGKEVFGRASFEDLTDVPEKVDLAVVVVGLALVPEVLDKCRDLGIRAVLIVSGGGKELGGDQVGLEQEIQRRAREYGIRVIGPNCIGCYNAVNRFDAFFQVHERMLRPKPGGISFMTQSGTYGASFLEECEHSGASKMISYGNRVDVDEADMIAYLARDPDTKVVGSYIEGLGDGRKFLRAAAEAIRTYKKPIVCYKSGRTARSAAAAQSHTGAYAGSYAVTRGALRQTGIIDVDSYEELGAVTRALGMQPPAAGPRVAMISNGAGPMVNAIDLFDGLGLEIAELSPESLAAMKEHYPAFYISKNPIDVTGSATSDDYLFAMECLAKDPNVHVIMNWFVFQDTPLDEAIVSALEKMNRTAGKPILCGAAGGPYTQRMSAAIEEVGVPMFPSAHLWAAAAHGLVRWGRVLAKG
ncbi:MAG: acetate--CoA ligase family protein [Deltaproteobacteria bacterium]|nr:acetate--CoA ligase family protein [Deltaproteobacteria bacterium]